MVSPAKINKRRHGKHKSRSSWGEDFAGESRPRFACVEGRRTGSKTGCGSEGGDQKGNLNPKTTVNPKPENNPKP